MIEPKPKKVSYELIKPNSKVGEPMYAMLEELVDKHHEDLAQARIALAWNLTWKPDVDGRQQIGKCKKASDLDRELMGFDFVIVLLREFWEEKAVDDHQRRALLDHELCHGALKLDKDGEPVEDERGREVYRIRKHDVEVLEAQVIENCQRKDIHPLEEAEGYRTLHEKYGYDVEEIAVKVGKSKAAVYARMKLCDLVGPVRKIFLQDEISASIALLIARIPVPELQQEAAKQVAGSDWEGPMSHRSALEHIQKKYMLRLSGAGFKTSDPDLVPEAGPCTICPKRTGNQKELFADVKSADVCTDPKCFDQKRQADWRRRVAASKDNGQKVLSEKETENLFRYGGGLSYNAPYVDLKSRCELDSKGRNFQKLLGKEAPQLVLARDANGNVHELLSRKEAYKALEVKGHAFAKNALQKTTAARSPAEKKSQQQARIRKETAKRAVQTIAEASGKRKPDAKFWRLLVTLAFSSASSTPTKPVLERHDIKLSEATWGEGRYRKLLKSIERHTEAQARSLALEILLADRLEYFSDSTYPVELVELGKYFRVDLKKLEASVKSELTPKKKSAKKPARAQKKAARPRGKAA